MKPLHRPVFALLLSSSASFCTARQAPQERLTETLAEGDFRYDEASGTCRNSKTEVGFNPAQLDQLFEQAVRTLTWTGGKAECVDFSGVNLSAYLHGENEGDYVRLKNWNFRGAKFDGTHLEFINIDHADLRGAQFKDAILGYSSITGAIDTYSRSPDACKRLNADEIECRL